MKILLDQLAKIERQENWILPTRNVIGFGSEEEVFDALISVRPIRFIKVAEGQTLNYSVVERCHKIGSEVICSEYISVSGEWHKVSLSVRSLLFPGKKTWGLTLAKEIRGGFFDELAPLCDTLIFDSELTGDVPDGAVIDLNWMRLAPIREELRFLYDMAQSHDNQGRIVAVKIYGESPSNWLLAGWICSKLRIEPESGRKIKEGISIKNDGFTLDLFYSSEFRILLEFHGKDEKIGVLSVRDGIITLEYAPEIRKRVYSKRTQKELCLEYDAFGAPTGSYNESVRLGREILEYAS